MATFNLLTQYYFRGYDFKRAMIAVKSAIGLEQTEFNNILLAIKAGDFQEGDFVKSSAGLIGFIVRPQKMTMGKETVDGFIIQNSQGKEEWAAADDLDMVAPSDEHFAQMAQGSKAEDIEESIKPTGPQAVIFRKWNKRNGGDVIAIFPENPSDTANWYNAEMYGSDGWAGGDIQAVMRSSTLATPEEYASLLKALQNQGIQCKIYSRETSQMRTNREKNWKEWFNSPPNAKADEPEEVDNPEEEQSEEQWVTGVWQKLSDFKDALSKLNSTGDSQYLNKLEDLFGEIASEYEGGVYSFFTPTEEMKQAYSSWQDQANTFLVNEGEDANQYGYAFFATSKLMDALGKLQ